MALYIQLSTQNVFTKYLSISSITGGNSVNTEQLTSTVASLATNSVVPPFISTQALFASSVTTSSLTTSSLTTTFLIASSLTTSSITANSVTSGVMSTLVLYASSIVGVTTGGGGIASIPSVLSTFAILTSSLQVSTVVANTLSTQQLFTSSLQGNNLVASNIFVSSGVLSTFSTNAVNFASGFGYLTMPDIYPNSVYTSTVTTSNLLIGTNSVISPIQFFGFGTYSNTVISELSTGGTTQELLFFRGSNAADRIRMQTTGSVVFEPGVSARIWPTAPSNVTPAMIINTSSNVGIQTATPGTALDVAGTGRFITLSTLNINVSTINGQVFGFPINSTVIGLGTSGYVSSLSLVSTVQGLGTSGYISSSQLLSTTSGLIDIPELLSSIAGLGSAGYISSLTMTSSINGAISSLSTAYGTIGGGGAISYLSSYTVSTGSIFTSSIITSSLLNTDGISTYSLTVYGPSTLTVQGYAYFTSIVSSYSLITGNVGFIDPITQQPVYLQATNGSITLNGSVALTQPILNSTVQGLGTVGYISTATGGSTTLPANISSITLSTFAIYASSIMVPYVYTPQYFTF